jgi:hypothetical protein
MMNRALQREKLDKNLERSEAGVALIQSLEGAPVEIIARRKTISVSGPMRPLA